MIVTAAAIRWAEIAAAREFLNGLNAPFEIPDDVYSVGMRKKSGAAHVKFEWDDENCSVIKRLSQELRTEFERRAN